MKLRVRVGKQTSRLELEGDQATLTDLTVQIKEIFLPACGIRSVMLEEVKTCM